MRASMAIQNGYKTGNAHPDDMGYEVTYPDGDVYKRQQILFLK